MADTSGTYDFQEITVEMLIREAFENIGILGEFVEANKLESAKRSIDFLLLEWMNKSINLWSLRNGFIFLKPGQSNYAMPNNVSDIIQMNLRTSTRQLNGTAESSSGVAANAFDGNLDTSCVNNAADGNIGYDWGANSQQINFIGVQSNFTRNYSLTVDIIPAGGVNWEAFFSVPTDSYLQDIIKWVEVPEPRDIIAMRIRETGGATLDIAELYFCNNIIDTPLSNVSRYEYFSYPNKNLQGRPSVYYYDRQIEPKVYIYPTPTSQYNCFSISYKSMLEDAGNYTDNLEIPSRLYPALVLGLTFKLALKFNPQTAGTFQELYERAFKEATVEDTENTPIAINVNWGY